MIAPLKHPLFYVISTTILRLSFRSCQKKMSIHRPLSNLINECGTLFIGARDTLFAQVPSPKTTMCHNGRFSAFQQTRKAAQPPLDRVTFCQFNTFRQFLASCVNRQTKRSKQVSREFLWPRKRNDLLFALMSKSNKMAQNKPCNCSRPANCNCCPTAQGRSSFRFRKGSDRFFEITGMTVYVLASACEVVHKLSPENGSRRGEWACECECEYPSIEHSRSSAVMAAVASSRP